MDLNENIKNNIQRLRKERNITQEILAAALEISVQAISKWETGISLPDIMQLPRIANFFGVTIDYLFYHDDQSVQVEMKELPDDDVLRVVQFRGNKLLGIDQWDKDKEILLRIPKEIQDNPTTKAINFEIQGNANIEGNISGYLECGGYVNCGNIEGYAESGGTINCGNISAYAQAGGGINCGNIDGYVESGGSINCGHISGYVECSGNLSCSEIMSTVECDGNIKCSEIHGSVECHGDITYTK
jgi:transcriptional regulator with XRE-family HTH domain